MRLTFSVDGQVTLLADAPSTVAYCRSPRLAAWHEAATATGVRDWDAAALPCADASLAEALAIYASCRASAGGVGTGVSGAVVGAGVVGAGVIGAGVGAGINRADVIGAEVIVVDVFVSARLEGRSPEADIGADVGNAGLLGFLSLSLGECTFAVSR